MCLIFGLMFASDWRGFCEFASLAVLFIFHGFFIFSFCLLTNHYGIRMKCFFGWQEFFFFFFSYLFTDSLRCQTFPHRQSKFIWCSFTQWNVCKHLICLKKTTKETNKQQSCAQLISSGSTVCRQAAGGIRESLCYTSSFTVLPSLISFSLSY